MTEGIKPMRFFLGANSPQGFVSRFDQLEHLADGWNTYIIKGGPGSGKSTLMKKLSAALRPSSDYIEEIYCSSDCHSLDGLIVHGKNFSVADGTPPHVLEPKYPGAYDSIISLFDCWDAAALRAHLPEIMRLCRGISALHAQSTRFLGAYDALCADNRTLALEHTDFKKLSDYSRRLAQRELRAVAGGQAHESVRFLSGVCDEGVLVFEDTARALARRIYVIDDEYCTCSAQLLSHLRDTALSLGQDVISCYCPMAPGERLEHLFIPALSLGFMTSNRAHPLSISPFRVIHARRFTDMDALRMKKQRMSFCRKAAAEMLRMAVGSLASAKSMHDELESCYANAMDYERLNTLTDGLIKTLDSNLTYP